MPTRFSRGTGGAMARTLDLHADPELSAQRPSAISPGAKAEAEFRRFSDKARRLFEAFDGPVMQEPAPKLAP
jgi:1-hydroxycarotenoid 3,4-desaturase